METPVPWRLRDAALLIVLGLAAPALGVLIVQGLYQLQGSAQAAPAQSPPVLTAAGPGLFDAAVIAGAWLLIVRRYGVRWSSFGLRRPLRQGLLPSAVLCLLLAIGSALWIEAASLLLASGHFGVRVVADSGLPSPRDPLFALGLVGALVVTPVVEELLFRGVLYQSLRQRIGMTSSTIVSAALFAALQPWPAVAPEFFMLGVVLALAFEQTGSLYPPMAIHAAYNGAIILVALHAA